MTTVTIELPDHQAAALSAKATEQGVSTEQYVRQVVEENLGVRADADAAPVRRRISEAISDLMADTPPEELARLPKDGASEHDHYIYGWPKRRR
ncbi:MAG: hypothetical protein ABSB15_11295 [Bryobacteraceae bacterium]|jgi:hypothetical protein